MLDMLAYAALAALAVTWMLYPLVMGLLAWVKRRNGAEIAGESGQVSIVLATRDHPGVIIQRIRNCLDSDYERILEVVVGLDRLGGLLPEDFPSFDDRVSVVVGDDPGGKATTLNAAVRECRGEILVFADTGQRFDRLTVGRLVSALLNPRVGAASGSLQIGTVHSESRSLVHMYWTLERWLRKTEAQVHSPIGVTGAVYAMKQHLWSPLPAHLILDDLHVPMRLILQGYRVNFVEDAYAYETRRHSVAGEYHRKVRTLTGVVQLCAWMPRVLSPFGNPVWLQFMFHKLLRFATPYCILILVLCLTARLFAFLPKITEISALQGAVSLAALAAIAVMGIRLKILALLRKTLPEAVTIQVAVAVALYNGVRGRWNVWKRETQ